MNQCCTEMSPAAFLTKALQLYVHLDGSFGCGMRRPADMFQTQREKMKTQLRDQN